MRKHGKSREKGTNFATENVEEQNRRDTQLGVRPPIWVSFFIIIIFLILPQETFTSL